jgi:hypothetical protein
MARFVLLNEILINPDHVVSVVSRNGNESQITLTSGQKFDSVLSVNEVKHHLEYVTGFEGDIR